MRTNVISALLFLLLTSCVSTAPDRNVAFDTITALSQLEGTYLNKGDGGTQLTIPVYLSIILWPEDTDLDHESIQTIVVTRESGDVLRASAVSQDTVLKSTLFTQGKDFTIKNGEITLSSDIGIAGFKSGEPMLGLYMGGSKIGIDKNGDGKYHSSGAAAGLVYLFLPMAISGSSDIRFRRIK